MDLLKAVQTEPLRKIEELVGKKGIPLNSKYFDYEALTFAISSGKKPIAKYLLEQNCRVNKSAKSANHNTPLHAAVKLADVELVNSLLSNKASIEAVNSDGDTALHLAFWNSHREIVDLLLSHAEKINDFTNVRNKHNLSHLHIACTTSRPLIVQNYLEAGANMDESVDEESPRYAGFTAMHFAVEFKSLVAIKTLHACRNFFVDYPEDCAGTTAPQLALNNMTTLSVACHLFDGGNFDLKNGLSSQLSLFHMACLRDNSSVIKKFIDHGAAVNTPVSKDAIFCPLYTPLHFAVDSNLKENVEVLLKHGAETDRLNGYSMTPLHLALYNEDHVNKSAIVDLLYAAIKDKTVNRVDINRLSYLHVACTRNDIETVRVLLEKNNDEHTRVRPNERNFSDFSPLHFTVLYRHCDLAEFLIDNGAMVDSTSLHIACEIGDVALINLLINKNVDVSSPRLSDGKTALHLLVETYMDNKDVCESVYNGDIVATAEAACTKDILLKYAKTFVRKGCDVNAKDKDGNTALHIACTKICDGGKCVKKLFTFGADINAENNEGHTPFDQTFNDDNRFEAADYVILYHHVHILKAIGLKVNPKNDECCERMIKELRDFGHEAVHESELLRKHRERNDEIVRLKRVKLTDRISLYDYLKLSAKRAAIYVQNITLMNTVMDKGLNKRFPLYGHMLENCYKKLENEPCIEYEGKRKADDDDVRLTRAKRRRI